MLPYQCPVGKFVPQRSFADVQRDPPLAIGELPARLHDTGAQHAGAQRARMRKPGLQITAAQRQQRGEHGEMISGLRIVGRRQGDT